MEQVAEKVAAAVQRRSIREQHAAFQTEAPIPGAP
jgi:hypothetical protein